MHSPDLIKRNTDELADLFPTVITETLDDEGNPVRAIDFDRLRQELSDHIVEGPQERYQLDWPGKRRALFAANAPIVKTLRPMRELSVDFDITQNLVIEGDNLDALKLLQESYLGKIKLIYIDPPYNTGNDIVYNDDFGATLPEYLVRSGQTDVEARRLVANLESNGRFHSDWLSMMYPRLKLARNILTRDGVIAISIDDGEHAGLRRLLDEVFGERNFLAQLIWNKQHSQQQGIFKRYHEYVLVYARDATSLDYISGGEGEIVAGALKKISKANPASEFDFPAGVRFDAPDGTTISGEFGDSEKVTVVKGVLRCENGVTAEPVTLRAGWTQKNQMKSWFNGQETVDTRGQKVTEFFFSGTGKLKCTKERNRITPPTILPDYGMNSVHTDRLVKLMGAAVFDNPKPVPLVQDLITWFTDDEDIVLDFFAGSGTTAEAALRISAETGKQRPFVLVQLGEPCREGSSAVTQGYRSVASIARERVIRAGADISMREHAPEWTRDVGFRYLRIDTTNLSNVRRTPDVLTQADLLSVEQNVKADRTGEDLLYQVLLDWGLNLSASIVTEEIDGYESFVVQDGELIACFEHDVSSSLVREIARREPARAVFRDSGFASDADRINAEQIFAEVSPATDIRTI